MKEQIKNVLFSRPPFFFGGGGGYTTKRTVSGRALDDSAIRAAPP